MKYLNLTRMVHGLIVVAALALGSRAMASPIVFKTPVGSLDSAGNPVAAEADFSFADGSLTLVLKNTQSGDQQADQLLTDIFFNLSSTTTGALTAVVGTQIHFDGGSGDVDPLTGNWRLQTGISPFPSEFHLDMLFQQPNLGIVGPNPNPGASLQTGSHNPLYDQQATFTITDKNIFANTTVSGVVFSWGTDACTSITDSNCIGGDPGSGVPEPISLGTVGIGLLALLALRRYLPAMGRGR